MTTPIETAMDPMAAEDDANLLERVPVPVGSATASMSAQQDSLLAAWNGENAGTEELRAAVQHYRVFGDRLSGFTREI
jgi:hypothetical protein